MSKLLLVEDDQSIVSSLSDYLGNEGFKIENAPGQKEALPLIFCYASSAASNSTKTEGPYFQTAERPRLVPNDFAEAIENRIAMYYNKGVKFSLASVRLSARSIVHR